MGHIRDTGTTVRPQDVCPRLPWSRATQPTLQKSATWSKTVSATIGALLAGSGVYASANLVSGSSGEVRAVTASNLTISAVAVPVGTNALYPGGTGDAVATIYNRNPYPVTITAVDLPADTTYATGYTSSALTTTQTRCLAATPSEVIWNYSTAASGSSHTLTTPVTVAASGQVDNPLTVTFTNDARMTATAPAACEVRTSRCRPLSVSQRPVAHLLLRRARPPTAGRADRMRISPHQASSAGPGKKATWRQDPSWSTRRSGLAPAEGHDDLLPFLETTTLSVASVDGPRGGRDRGN